MTVEAVMASLEATGIRLEEDYAVPINGVNRPLPYMVARNGTTIIGSDNGAVNLERNAWTVALFTANRAPELEKSILRALARVGEIQVERFPDGKPYQTNFEFTTTQAFF